MGLFEQFKSVFVAPKRLDVCQRFEVLREGIAGTMSKFYAVRDRATGDTLGLKILDPQKTATFEARFPGLKKPSEGEIALRMRHPVLVRTFEHGLTTDGSQYLLMEYLGGSIMLSLMVARDPILDGRRLRYIKQAAEGLAAVHDAGFIHRDVCPRNLILTTDRETAKLTDFGLTVPATPPFMQPGNRTGTPNYMAPEIVRRQKTDRRVDVFAFGVTAYEILTGELPWPRGQTGMAAMGHDQPPADICGYRPTIHPDLANVIHACIQPEPRYRLPSMDEFLKLTRRIEHEDA